MRRSRHIHRPLNNMFAVISDVQYAAVKVSDGFHPRHWRGLEFPYLNAQLSQRPIYSRIIRMGHASKANAAASKVNIIKTLFHKLSSVSTMPADGAVD